jgi:hypothetical protein
MEKEFIPYKLALELKELGYDEPCLMYWYEASNGYVLVNKKDQTFQPYTNAPLYQQAFRWFREKYGYNCFVTSSILDGGKWYYFRENLNDREDDSEPELTPKFDTYEEAELECLKKLIEIVKNK